MCGLGEPRGRIRPYRSHGFLQIFPPQPTRADPGPFGRIRDAAWRAAEDNHAPEPWLVRVPDREDPVQQAIGAHFDREAIRVSVPLFDDFDLDVVSVVHESPFIAAWQAGTDRARAPE